MKTLIYWLLPIVVCLACVLPANAQKTIFEEPLSNRIASYNISAKLDTDKKTITAKQTLTWVNNADMAVSELHFHAYMNAFKNNQSTLMKEKRKSFIGSQKAPDAEKAWGWIDLRKATTDKNEDILETLKYIAPDDNNTKDQTVFTLTLPQAAQPGDTVRLFMDFVTKLPKIVARSGYSHNFFFVGQWFPKIGVYENVGERGREVAGWNCHQYHASSEFFADFGVYNVDINVPKDYVVASGGMLIDKKARTDGTNTWYFRAEDIVDFAWTASERYKIAKTSWHHVNIEVYLQPEHFHMAKRHTESVKAALDFFAEKLDTFPYPHMTIIDPPYHGSGAGGMEYTTLFTAGSMNYVPDGLMYTELVTIHEFGHAYFMGMLATNEFEEPWMDEGMNTYFEHRIMDKTYGEQTSMLNFMGIKIGDTETARWGVVSASNMRKAEVYRTSWGYPYGGYGAYSYSKPAIMLRTFENIWGEATMDKIMKTYFQRWKFKHPDTHDFLKIVNEILLADFGEAAVVRANYFFNEFLFGNGVADFAVTQVYNRSTYNTAGILSKGSKKTFVLGEMDKNTDTEYLSRVRVERLGDVALPVEVLVTFESGKEVLEIWDANETATEFSYTGNDKITKAVVDPKHKLLLDINYMNNSYTVKQQSSVFRKLFLDVLNVLQNFLQFFVWLV